MKAADPVKAADTSLSKKPSDAAADDFWSYLVNNRDDLLRRPGVRIASLIVFVGICGMFAWFVAGWGAFHQLHRVSRLRSLVALSLFFLFSIPVTAVMFFIANLTS